MISRVLLRGKANAQTGKDICKLLKMTQRDLTAAVERERRAGKPICASTGAIPGYYLAASKSEMQTYCNSLQHRSGEIQKTLDACVRTIEELPQESQL